jgi:glucokinase
VDREEGMLKVHPRNQWNNKNVREDFRRLTGFQGDVTIENNAGVRALGAQLFRRNELWNVQSFVYLFVDTGIACPLIVESSGYTGSVVGSGELGHMVMEPDGLECSCGNHGCLEAYSSDQAVVKRCMKALEKGGAPELQKLCIGSDSVPSMQQIMLAQNRGDPDVTAIVEDAIRMLAVAVSNIINFASPESVLIDCKLFWNEQNRQKLLDTARQNLCNKTYQGTKTIFVEPDPASGARGAAAVAINQNLG